MELVSYGRSVALHGTTALIGGTGSGFNGLPWGAAYIVDATTGEELHRLVPHDPQRDHGFGNSVALTDRYAIVGASEDDEAHDQAGAVYIFDRFTGEELRKITSNRPRLNDRFGFRVATSGGLLAIASLQTPSRHTAIYLYDPETAWEFTSYRVTDRRNAGSLGRSLAFDGDTIVVGGPDDDEIAPKAGAAFVFDASVRPCSPADYAPPYGLHTTADLVAYLRFFDEGDLLANMNDTGIGYTIDLEDINEFLAVFAAPCVNE